MLQEKLTYINKIKKKLLSCENKREMLEWLMAYGKQLPPYPEEYMQDQYKVDGCISNVYIAAQENEGKLYFFGRSDSLIVRGYVRIVVEALSNLEKTSFSEVKKALQELIESTGIAQSAVPSRQNAFANVLEHAVALDKRDVAQNL